MSVEQTSQRLEKIATAADFARELQALRERSGLTIREVARAAKTSVSTTGDCFSGRHLPADREQFTRILAACGEDDQERIEAWQAALARVRRSPGPRGEPPYRGLARYEASDERLFFGRENITELVAFLAEQASDLPLMLVGASGAGKSSLLRAGLLPRLRAAAEAAAPYGRAGGDRVAIYDLTVTGVSGLAARVAEAAGAGRDGGTGAGGSSAGAWDLARTTGAWGATGPVADNPALDGTASASPVLDGTAPTPVIVDQFEAVFTLCSDETERGALISALCELARTRLVVLALRADFYGSAIAYPGLLRALQERHVVLGPMTAEQVRRAVVEPARLARADVEESLVEVVLVDLAPREAADGQAHEPGALPLLSHAMLAAWEHSRGGTVTVADYLAGGGIRDALTQSAEHAYDSLTPGQRLLSRRLLLRLVHVSDDLPPSRAPVPLSELRDTGAGSKAADGTDADRVLDVFVRERMITVDADSAQFTHDALLSAWPRLRTWIEENAEALRARRRILEGARAWAEAGQEEAALWRGSQLMVAREWAGIPERRAELPGRAVEFVDASVAAGTVREAAERRRVRRLRGTVAVLAALVLVVAGLSGYAFSLRQKSVSAEHAAVVSAKQANSRAVSFIADQTASTDPAAAAQLAAAAYSMYPTPQAKSSLLDATDTATVARVEDSAGIVQWVSLSPDHQLLVAAGADGSLRLWDIATPGHPVAVGTLLKTDTQDPQYAAAFSPDGTIIAAAGADRTVQLWRVSGSAASPAVTALGTPLSGPANTVYTIAFSPDGQLLAAGSADGTVRLWNMAEPAQPKPAGKALTVPGATKHVNSVAFSADSGELAAGTSDGLVMTWKLSGSAAPVPYSHLPLTGPKASVSGVAFSPAGLTLAASSQDHDIYLWTLHPAKKGGTATSDGTLTGASNWANTVAFSPDGTSLAAGTSDASVLVWNLVTRSVTATVPQPQPVTSVAWDGGNRIAASDADGTIALISLPSAVLPTGNSPANVAYSPDGTTIAVGGTSVQLWSTASRTVLATRTLPSGVYVNATAFSRAGVIAVALSDGTVALLNGHTLAPLGSPFPVITGAGAAESVAFSPNGTEVATGADDGSVRLTDVSDPAHPRLVATGHGSGSSVYTVAFAPDGTTIAAASVDNVVRLWSAPSGTGTLTLAGAPLGGMSSYAIGLAFSPDSKVLAVGSADKTVHLWDVADTAHPVLLGTPLTGPSGYVWAAAFSPDGKVLAVGATDGTVWLWNVSSPAHPVLIATLTGPSGHVYGVAFSPSGAQLAATSYDGSVHLWDTSAAAAVAGICANLGQALTRAEWASYVPGVAYRAACPS
jgi:WD40 repeat protein